MRSHQAHTRPPPAELWLHTRVFPAFPADRHPAVLSCGKDHGTPLYLPHFPAFSPCPPPLPAPRRLLALPVLASLPLPHPFPGKIPFPLFSRGRSPLAPACAGNKCKIHLFCTGAVPAAVDRLLTFQAVHQKKNLALSTEVPLMQRLQVRIILGSCPLISSAHPTITNGSCSGFNCLYMYAHV